MKNSRRFGIRSRLWSGLIGGCLLGASAHAQPVFSEDFEAESFEGWVVTEGRGDVAVTSYDGNASARLRRDAAIVRRVDIEQVSDLSVSLRFAALDLEGNDRCVAEVSVDGLTWFEIGSVNEDQADGVTLTRVHRKFRFDEPPSQLYLGLRVEANADNDTCWADNILISQERSIESLPSIIPAKLLWDSESQIGPVSTAAFVKPPTASPSDSPVTGVLELSSAMMEEFIVYKDGFGYAPDATLLKTIPVLTIELSEVTGDVVPLRRGPLAAPHPGWEWVLAPGKSWRDNDLGDTVIVLPFSLQERNANCLHNGLLTFRINSAGDTSGAFFQIGSETCAYMQFDAWGRLPAHFSAQTPANSEQAAAAYRQEVARRLPTKPIGDLPNAHEFAHPDEVTQSSLTTYGYVADGVHYVGGCQTRFGDHPYCDVLDIPSYSLAKSFVAGVAAMRLERLYPGAMQEHIADYVPECAKANWGEVTFLDALNMSTGRYGSAVYDQDEASGSMRKFFMADSSLEKLKIACGSFPRKEDPGQRFVYQTSNTFIFGAAMSAYLQTKQNDPDADFFDDLILPIWEKLGVSPVATLTRRTYDDAKIPFAGWGITLYPNDLALITQFLQSGGVLDRTAVLDERMLKEAMQENGVPFGLEAFIPSQRYRHGFWSWNAGPTIGCNDDRWVPAMSGYGGLSVALLPNGSTYYYISDGGDFRWARAAAASNQLDAYCEASE